MRLVAVVVALVACVHAGLWALSEKRVAAPDIEGPLASLSYGKHPDKHVSVAEIRSDLTKLAPYTRAIRTYSVTNGLEMVPQIAAQSALRVTAGAWLGGSLDAAEWQGLGPDPSNARRYRERMASRARNSAELAAAIEIARRNSNIDGLVLANEAIYRGETIMFDDETLSPEEVALVRAAQQVSKAEETRVKERINVGRLIKAIREAKRQVSVPVTTGEIWSVWRDHPELVAAVDYIAVHILPYWEGAPDQSAVDAAIGGYHQLRQMYPGKRIVIAEFGWPSNGYNFKLAQPGHFEQAHVIRDFVARANAIGIDYNIIEALDQPWKISEGSVGAYWGLFNDALQQKFAWTGPIIDPEFRKLAILAVLLGVLFSLPLLAMSVTLTESLVLAAAAHVVGAWFAAVFAFWKSHYFVWGEAFALGLGVTLLVPLVLIALGRVEEIAAVAFGRKPRRLLNVEAPPLAPEAQGYAPKVSIHVPAYKEEPEMLKATLDAVAGLNYPNFECIVIINNTPDPYYWEPIEAHCRVLGERFKFLREDKVEGFKAGALRIALAHTAPDAEIIGIIDADYVVAPGWLSDLVPVFADPKVGLVQAPQEHRDGDRSLMHYSMAGEYSGFFDIGMVERNEKNAIVVHGTMCLMRREALAAAGNWSSDTICEDTDLGLTMLELGWTAHYTNRRYGFGLLPDTFGAYKKQRHRWAYGGVQIVKKHWRRFLPGVSSLNREQKRAFLLGWLNWLGAEALGVLVAIFNLLWVPVVAFAEIGIPSKILTIPILAAFAVTILHFSLLYRLRVAIPKKQTVGAVFAAMALQLTVARAVADGVIKDHLPFNRTAKGNRSRKPVQFDGFWELILGSLLIIGAIVLIANNPLQITEIYLFAIVLMVQSLPFLSAAGLAAIEGRRINEFAFWNELQPRLLAALRRRPAAISAQTPAIASAIADAQTSPAGEKQPETVQ
ncbi:glycosyltransferase [Pseudorhodoplanes sp.]|uniref:glycosyltransferase n=1 Tax=Pseudorhodoplanes sp. TaxID=1934341 RepID=UPI003918750D